MYSVVNTPTHTSNLTYYYGLSTEKWLTGLVAVMVGSACLLLIAIMWFVCWKLRRKDDLMRPLLPVGTSFRQDNGPRSGDNDACSIDSHDNNYDEEWNNHYENIATVIRNIRRGRRHREIINCNDQVVEENYDCCHFNTCLDEDTPEEIGSVGNNILVSTRC